VLGGNPGSFALGFAALLLLMANTAGLLGARLASRSSSVNVVARLLTLPLAVTLGELSFAFYAFHLVPVIYARNIGLQFPPSAALTVAAALGLAIPAHFYVEGPVYRWAGKRLPRCSCQDDHEGLRGPTPRRACQQVRASHS
jgi:peptidoglycan/LPS O-acetylase OafA/YrhL